MSSETTAPRLVHQVHADLDQILIGRDRIARRVAELGEAISRDLADLPDPGVGLSIGALAGVLSRGVDRSRTELRAADVFEQRDPSDAGVGTRDA